MKIVLIGYMGSGKSTVGNLLAKKMNLAFLDLDQAIEEQEKIPVPQIFEQHGEIYFRKKETEALKRLLAEKEDMVLAAGGGTPCYGHNMDNIEKSTAKSIYLKLSIQALVERIRHEKAERPLVSSLADEDFPEFIGKHLFERTPFYERADEVVFCDGKTPEEIVDEILSSL
ncbi:shikimate kinase [Allomuricauda sp. SCSIO 65647]|uniref:shikimate kinase n=1 Tax=Allomuricauda sp. SCSIO 65647 TaxID=2908843 RepID=UPI001F2F48AB|nr:shikimate kinase [Muricauda sp. SCSIO 65647]UJH67974.1 shikimate kinase [Muricauda sp. SCSIO 65647]